MSSSTSPDNAGNDTVSTGMADSPPNANGGGGGGNDGDASGVPKPKRLACMICRKRKLKCDGSKPSCSTCTRLGHSCAYDEVRRKSGPKRGYVKALEERLSEWNERASDGRHLARRVVLRVHALDPPC